MPALVILSGGLDSTVCMAIAVRNHHDALALTFDYGQRHRMEIDRAGQVAAHYGAEQLIVALDASRWGGSALTDHSIAVPHAAPPNASDDAIPVTYVPARNLVFLAVAMGVAEARKADDVYLGVNALDYSGYPDCRPEFVRAFERAAALALKRGVEGNPVAVRTPLIDRTKADIVRLGLSLNAPLQLTWSCYRGGSRPCGDCDACALRAKGFAEAGVRDPALDV
jgi:7-cyano-7-deazaguanine synthase